MAGSEENSGAASAEGDFLPIGTGGAGGKALFGKKTSFGVSGVEGGCIAAERADCAARPGTGEILNRRRVGEHRSAGESSVKPPKAGGMVIVGMGEKDGAKPAAPQGTLCDCSGFFAAEGDGRIDQDGVLPAAKQMAVAGGVGADRLKGEHRGKPPKIVFPAIIPEMERAGQVRGEGYPSLRRKDAPLSKRTAGHCTSGISGNICRRSKSCIRRRRGP